MGGMTAGRVRSRGSLGAALLVAAACLLSPPASKARIHPDPRASDSPCTPDARFEELPCMGRKARPASLAEFLAAPSREEWEAQLALGWRGSDGSTAVPDEVGGVRIGRSTPAHEASDLPANRHDWYYELGRSYGLGPRFRLAADRAYRDMCLARVAHLPGLRGVAARADVHLRYVALRVVGLGAWVARPGARPAPAAAISVAGASAEAPAES